MPDRLANMTPRIILTVDDDAAIRRLLKVCFESTPHTLIGAESAAEGLELVLSRRPDLILLDLGLPDSDGLALMKTIRSWSKIPIIVLSGSGNEERKVEALENGADDYITKPFSVGELLARVSVAFRHADALQTGQDDPVMELGDLRIDAASREVTMRGERVQLTPIEYKLLLTLAKHAGKVVTHRQLLVEVWGPEYADEAQYLRVYIGYLRKKIEGDSKQDSIFLNEPRVGYRLAV